jgi:GNAT superfamily N-acetyltransferase
MSVTFRPYQHSEDYQKVSDFLIRHYQEDNQDLNWPEPAWEYMHFHPALQPEHLDKIGVWEDDGAIVAVAHYEWSLGEAFFQFHPNYHYLQAEMLNHAEAHFPHQKDDGSRELYAFIPDQLPDFTNLAKARGYERGGYNRPMSQMVIPDPFPEITLPKGFRLTSLAEAPDWAKVNRVLWRGFNHEGPPPETEKDLEERRIMFDTPKARRDLKVAVAAPDGQFVSFCGMFYEAANRYAYVEPVATDPDYRRMGLGRAAVLEGIRRCAELGARVAYVGSDQAFYLSFGFKLINTEVCWVKTWED